MRWIIGLLVCLVAIAPAQAGSFNLMVASFYWCSNAPGEGGTRTAQGRRCDPKGMNAAHRSLPFGTILNVCIGRHCVGVTVNDRGPYIRGRDLDLTVGAARSLGLYGRGVARVRVNIPLPKERPAIEAMFAEGP